MRRLSARALTTTIMLLVGALVASCLGSAAEAADGVEPGTLIAQRWQVGPSYIELRSASPSYIAYRYGQYDESGGPQLQAHRVSDGSVVAVLPSSYVDTAYEPYLAGDSYVRPVEDPAVYAPGSVEVYAVETGARTATTVVPRGDRLLRAGASWVLTARSDGTSRAGLHVLGPDGTDTLVSGVSVGQPRVVATEANAALVQDDRRLYLVQMRPAQATLVSDSLDVYADVALTPHRIFWVNDVFPDGTHVDRITWVDRDGAGAGSGGTVDVSAVVQGYRAFGDRLAAVWIPPGGSWDRTDLSPVDLATGNLETPVASSVAYARSMEDGRVALALADTPTGRIATVGDDGQPPRTVTELPPIALQTHVVLLSRGRVAATWQAGDAEPVYFAAADGTGGWTPPDGGPDPAIHYGGEGGVALAGDTLLTSLSRAWAKGFVPFRLTWPGGHRDVEAAYGAIKLGNGGKLVLRAVSTDGWTVTGYEAQDVRTGAVLATPSAFDRVALDDTWIWQPAAGTPGQLVGTDTSGASPQRTVATGVTCPADPEVRGRWALLRCDTGEVYAADLRGVLPPWRVPLQPTDRGLALGGGFVAWVRYVDTAPGVSLPTLVVADLSGDHATRSYGPVRGLAFPPGPSFAVDDSGARQLVYADPQRQVRRVSVDWVGNAPLTRVDATAPVLTGSVGSPRVVPASAATTPVAFDWSYSDPTSEVEPASGVAGYDVRYQQANRLGGPYGAWVTPAAWQGLGQTGVTLPVAAGIDTCFQVRARDARGNVSPWSPSRCSAVDGTPPTVTLASAGARIAARTTASTATFAYAAQDAFGTASYDVSYQVAAPGRSLGPWTYPAAWQRTRSTSVTQSVGVGSDLCFRVRARDVAGNTSVWSSPRCVTVPYDDRALAAGGRVDRVTSALALSGTVSRLATTGSTVVRTGQTGAQVAVVVLRGPRQGAVDVYAGSRWLGRVYLAAATWHRDVVLLPRTGTWTGTVWVRSVSSAPSLIDAVAVLR